MRIHSNQIVVNVRVALGFPTYTTHPVGLPYATTNTNFHHNPNPITMHLLLGLNSQLVTRDE